MYGLPKRSAVTVWKIGDEFVELSKGAFIVAKKGHGTHAWDGSKIVPKPKRRKNRKKGATVDV